VPGGITLGGIWREPLRGVLWPDGAVKNRQIFL